MKIRRSLCAAVMLISVIGIFTFCIVSTVSAKGQEKRTKNVTSIEIMPGDTLWGIATQFMSKEYQDVNEYVQEIKRCNQLYDDTIQAGHSLIIPYYAYE